MSTIFLKVLKIVGDIGSSDFISNQIKYIFQKPNVLILR